VILYWCHTSIILVNVTLLQIQISIIVSISTFFIPGLKDFSGWPSYTPQGPYFPHGHLCLIFSPKLHSLSECLPLGTYHRLLRVHLSETRQIQNFTKQSYCEITHLDKFSVFKWDSCTQFVKLPTQSTLYYKKYYVLRSYKSKKGDFHIFSKWPALEQFRRPIKVLDNALMSQPRYTPRDYWFYLFRTPVYRELETGSTNQFLILDPA
jgi:hypothetical protein